ARSITSSVSNGYHQGRSPPRPQPPPLRRRRRARLRALLRPRWPGHPDAAGGGADAAVVPPPWPLPDRRPEAEGVHQRAQRARRRQDRSRPRRLLPAALRARRPRRRRLPLHRRQGQRARHETQPRRRSKPHPQQVRQDLPLRLHLLIELKPCVQHVGYHDS
ncbi:Os10g0552300, partial [Oryza sativa Japonica Group]